MKKSKLRNRLKAQLLFAGFTVSDISDFWYEVTKNIKNINFTITIHHFKHMQSSVRVYSQKPGDVDYTRYDMTLNKNSFQNIIMYIENYGKTKT